MATQTDPATTPRAPLTRERVLQAAVDLADESGIDAISMRKVGHELGVEAMSLYNHVANKEDLLDGMVDIVVGEIALPPESDDWKTTMRDQALRAREVLMRHQWAPRVIETRVNFTPTMMTYMDAMIGIFLRGGFSVDLAHHALHALGSRVLGFVQEPFREADAGGDHDPEMTAAMFQQMAAAYPNIGALMAEISHNEDDILGDGCDDQFEFEFALDIMLEGLERKHALE